MKKVLSLAIFAVLLTVYAYAYDDYSMDESESISKDPESIAATTRAEESEAAEEAAYSDFMTPQGIAAAPAAQSAIQSGRVETTSSMYGSEPEEEDIE